MTPRGPELNAEMRGAAEKLQRVLDAANRYRKATRYTVREVCPGSETLIRESGEALDRVLEEVLGGLS